MNWEAIVAITEIIGLILVLASLVYISFQTKQTNEHATASAETEWIINWNQILRTWVDDERITTTIRNGFRSFNSLSKTDQAVFQMYVANMVNHWLLAHKLAQKGLISSDIESEARKLVIAVLCTGGGSEYFESQWQHYPEGAYLMEQVKANRGQSPSWTDLMPWWLGDE